MFFLQKWFDCLCPINQCFFLKFAKQIYLHSHQFQTPLEKCHDHPNFHFPSHQQFQINHAQSPGHGLWTPREEIAFTARPRIQSQSQIFRYGRSIFCLPHRPNFSDIFDLCLHWVSVVRARKRWLMGAS